MFIKLLIISIILVSVVMLALGIKLWFDPDAEFNANSCKLNDENANSVSGCPKCELKDLVNCSEEPVSKIKTK